MTGVAAAWASVAVAVLALAWVASTWLLSRALRQATRGGERDAQLTRLITDVDKLVQDKDRAHDLLARQMADDRAATDRRLRWLEEHLWMTSRQAR